VTEKSGYFLLLKPGCPWLVSNITHRNDFSAIPLALAGQMFPNLQKPADHPVQNNTLTPKEHSQGPNPQETHQQL